MVNPGKFVEALGPISFSIPLAQASNEAVLVNGKETEELDEGLKTEAHGCKGTLPKPTAPKGKLCVYTGFGEFVDTEGFQVVGIEEEGGREGGLYGPSGAYVKVAVKEETGAKATVNGTWAVTAP